jgi:hypothetical protein
VYYFSGKNECDFLIKENLRVTEAMQVVYALNAENIQREIDGLAEAMHTFNIPKGTLIVFDAHTYGRYKYNTAGSARGGERGCDLGDGDRNTLPEALEVDFTGTDHRPGGGIRLSPLHHADIQGDQQRSPERGG